MSDEIPQWAFDRVDSLTREECDNQTPNRAYGTTGNAFARYIMQHEEPPVDKDVLAVREILASQYGEVTDVHGEYIQGYHDGMAHFQDALAAYRKHKQ